MYQKSSVKSRRCPNRESWSLEENGLNFEFALSKVIWYELWLLLMLVITKTDPSFTILLYEGLFFNFR